MIPNLGIYLIISVISLLGFIALIFGISVENKRKEKELEMKYQKPSPVPAKKIPKKDKNDQILFTLEFMLQNNIITTQEYNKLMVKCLPFME